MTMRTLTQHALAFLTLATLTQAQKVCKFPANLRYGWESGVIDVHRKGTPEYNDIMISGTQWWGMMWGLSEMHQFKDWDAFFKLGASAQLFKRRNDGRYEAR